MAIRFFFEYNKTVVQLPVNPEKLNVTVAGSNSTEQIVKLGEINLLKDRKLISLDIASFFPVSASAPYVLTKGKFEGPNFYRDFFEKIQAEKKPVRFIVSDTNINFLASVESFQWGYKAGDDDMQYTLKLKEYREYSAKVVTIKAAPTASNPNAQATSNTKTRAKTGFAIGDTVKKTVCEEYGIYFVSAPCRIKPYRYFGGSHVASSVGLFGACYVAVICYTAVLSLFHAIAACQQVVVVPVAAVE